MSGVSASPYCLYQETSSLRITMDVTLFGFKLLRSLIISIMRTSYTKSVKTPFLPLTSKFFKRTVRNYSIDILPAQLNGNTSGVYIVPCPVPHR